MTNPIPLILALAALLAGAAWAAFPRLRCWIFGHAESEYIQIGAWRGMGDYYRCPRCGATWLVPVEHVNCRCIVEPQTAARQRDGEDA